MIIVIITFPTQSFRENCKSLRAIIIGLRLGNSSHKCAFDFMEA